MITVNKLKIYCQYDGDIDGWVRSMHGLPSPDMTDDDWYDIEKMRLGLFSIYNLSCSESYKEQVLRELRDNADGEDAIIMLKEIAKTKK